MNSDLQLILERLQREFKPRRNTRYWLQIVNDPYDASYNFFFDQQRLNQRLKSLPLHSVPGNNLVLLEQFVDEIRKQYQFSIEFEGFTGLIWPVKQSPIQRKKFWEE